ncbi:branched-chain amino acid transport system II carrier protein [Campylobacter iguaniorum]|uniref:Branched-chain amino acid transport system II carrier protein n=1 Tax=Campylobacter iguaniorum TaxID=1244531 RepID=A0A076FAP1_9BACT|nr:branched-chain amino acid transport system II carrier protein [Campylobacter iguaniorum]AII15031.1 branched-chain amino acid transport system II carrier protein [Campylobacter iguaniorum]
MRQVSISNRDFLIISLMLFSMFFGAGNFIFPPMVGKEAGINFYEAILFFCITAVLLPVLGIAAVAKSGTLDKLVYRVDKYFAPIFTILVYIIIGPLLAIPRAANMPYEISLSPYLADSWLVVYMVIYFVLNYIVCINKTAMIDTMGRWLTPIMLVLICLFFIVAIVGNMGEFSTPIGKYATSPASSGFLDGYQTMDAMAALVFGIVVVSSIKQIGVNQSIVSTTIKSGVFAGIILACIYIMLAYIGASSASLFPDTKNGANILSLTTNYLFGGYGAIILGAIFLLACFTTTVGLISSASEYFSKFNHRLGYKFWVFAWSFLSFCMANIGLNEILKYSIPILTTFYPVSIVLIILSLIDHFIDSSKIVYRSCIYTTLVISLVHSLQESGLLDYKFSVLNFLPFYDAGLGWIIPTLIAFCISYLIFRAKKRGGI